MATVWIGLGSNLGDREKSLNEAVARMQSVGLDLVEKGRIYETEPWGMVGVPDFLNRIVKITTDADPITLVAKLQRIEMQMGRTRDGEGYSSRVIDLDILFWENLIFETPELRIPHPGAHLRKFVLLPMSDLEPELVHPVFQKTMLQLLEECEDPGQCRLYLNTAI